MLTNKKNKLFQYIEYQFYDMLPVQLQCFKNEFIIKTILLPSTSEAEALEQTATSQKLNN